jgi:hypothetical protein
MRIANILFTIFIATGTRSRDVMAQPIANWGVALERKRFKRHLATNARCRPSIKAVTVHDETVTGLANVDG